MTPRAIALSPHLDDAAFSCGGTIAWLVRRGWTVTIATVFTRSVAAPTGFALACQTDKGLAPEVDYMALRRAEDQAACAVLGARPVWLDFAEAPHRGYSDAAALFAAPRSDDAILPGLTEAIAGLLAPPPALVLAPQAIGGHVDHVLVVRALRAVLPAAVPVLWWTDHPYAARAGSAPYADAFDALPEHAIAIDPPTRLAACAAYTTQLGFQFGGASGLAAALAARGATERHRVQGTVPA